MGNTRVRRGPDWVTPLGNQKPLVWAGEKFIFGPPKFWNGPPRLCFYVFVVVFMSLLLCCVSVHLHPSTLGGMYTFSCLPAHSTGRFRLLRKYKDVLFRDEEEDEDRIIIDLEWSSRAWVVVSQLPPLTHNERGIIDNGDDSTREGCVINGFLHRMIATTNLNTKHMQALGGDCTESSTGISCFSIFLGWGSTYRKIAPGPGPPFGGLAQGLFFGPFLWPYFINKIPPVKTHRGGAWPRGEGACVKRGLVGSNPAVIILNFTHDLPVCL